MRPPHFVCESVSAHVNTLTRSREAACSRTADCERRDQRQPTKRGGGFTGAVRRASNAASSLTRLSTTSRRQRFAAASSLEAVSEYAASRIAKFAYSPSSVTATVTESVESRRTTGCCRSVGVPPLLDSTQSALLPCLLTGCRWWCTRQATNASPRRQAGAPGTQ